MTFLGKGIIFILTKKAFILRIWGFGPVASALQRSPRYAPSRCAIASAEVLQVGPYRSKDMQLLFAAEIHPVDDRTGFYFGPFRVGNLDDLLVILDLDAC